MKRFLSIALALVLSCAILPTTPALASGNRGFIVRIDQLDEQKNVIAKDVTQLSNKGYIRITMSLDSAFAASYLEEVKLYIIDGKGPSDYLSISKSHLLSSLKPTSGTVVLDIKLDSNTVLEGDVCFELTGVVKKYEQNKYGLSFTSSAYGYSVKYSDDTQPQQASSIELMHNENIIRDNTRVLYRSIYSDGVRTPPARVYPATAYPVKIHWRSSNPAVGTIRNTDSAALSNSPQAYIDLHGTGETIITAYTDSGAKAEYRLVVSDTPGWQKINNTWYYLLDAGEDTYRTHTIEEGGKVYRIAYCMMVTGWEYNDDGTVQYFDEKTGAMQVGWFKLGDRWYYSNTNRAQRTYGHLKSGWLKDGSKWYYLDKQGLHMRSGWILDGNAWYYLSGSGAMQTGWIKTGGKWYYLSSSGAMQTGWVKAGGKWYYLDGSGSMQTGWVQLGGKWYYLSGSGAMVTGTQRIGGKSYKFDSSGAWIA